jgi:hypothetical protein
MQAFCCKVKNCFSSESPIYKERVKWLHSVPGHVADTNYVKYVIKYPSFIRCYYYVNINSMCIGNCWGPRILVSSYCINYWKNIRLSQYVGENGENNGKFNQMLMAKRNYYSDKQELCSNFSLSGVHLHRAELHENYGEVLDKICLTLLLFRMVWRRCSLPPLF